MSKYLFVSVCTFLSLLLGYPHHAEAKKMAPKELQLNPAASSLEWVGTKKLGGRHMGKVTLKKGMVTFDGENFLGGEIEIDLASIEVTDIPKDNKDNQKLVTHLKSDDFFGVDKYPTAKFVIKSAKKLTPKEYEFVGDLTIKGVTKPHTLRAEITMNDKETRATGTLKIDRTEFGIKYGSANFFKLAADRVINNDFELKFNLVAQ
ncbi:MAG: YceI family protein [Bdellovibrionaceae bacterium]|nr:YceI family protein [Pseudobdellovibrionaceae bacterium]MDW8191211.1 YceI family protein [Pseudobdellovibrionaceae bacterium]